MSGPFWANLYTDGFLSSPKPSRERADNDAQPKAEAQIVCGERWFRVALVKITPWQEPVA